MALLGGLFVLTAMLGQIMSNTATTLIVIPIAIAAADGHGRLAAAGDDERLRGGRGVVPDAHRHLHQPHGDGPRRLPLRRLLEARPAADGLVLRRRHVLRPAGLAVLTGRTFHAAGGTMVVKLEYLLAKVFLAVLVVAALAALYYLSRG